MLEEQIPRTQKLGPHQSGGAQYSEQPNWTYEFQRRKSEHELNDMVGLIWLILSTIIYAQRIVFSVPSSVSLPSSSQALLRSGDIRLNAPISTSNLFKFNDISSSRTWHLSVICRDYEFASYGIRVQSQHVIELYKTSVGGIRTGNVTRYAEPFELQPIAQRVYLEERQGCRMPRGEDQLTTVSPLSLLKSPIILIGIVGLAFAIGIPYLLENMDPEMRAEFEEQQRKGIFGTGAGGGAPNPLQNFDMAAWMAGESKTSEQDTGSVKRR